MITILLLILLIFLLLALSMVWPPDSPWSPWWRTSKKIAQRICVIAEVDDNDIVYELGSGDGTFLAVAAKEFRTKGIGIEVDLLRWCISTLMIYIIKVEDKVKIVRGNFFDKDISQATVVYVYLVPRVLEKLKQKFIKELQPGTKIISYVYTIDFLPLVRKDEKNKIYIYKIPLSFS